MLAVASPPPHAGPGDGQGPPRGGPGDGADACESSFDFGFLRDTTPPASAAPRGAGASGSEGAAKGAGSGAGSGARPSFSLRRKQQRQDIPVMADDFLDENCFASPALMRPDAAGLALRSALRAAKRDAQMLAPVTPLRRSPFADKTNLAVIRDSVERGGGGAPAGAGDDASMSALKENNLRLVERLSSADAELRALKEALRSKECGVSAMLKVLGEQSTSHIALEAENGELQGQINMMASEVMELQRQLTSLQVRGAPRRYTPTRTTAPGRARAFRTSKTNVWRPGATNLVHLLGHGAV